MLRPNLFSYEVADVINHDARQGLVVEARQGDVFLAKAMVDITGQEAFLDKLVIDRCHGRTSLIASFMMDEIELQLSDRGVTTLAAAPTLAADGFFERKGYARTGDVRMQHNSRLPVVAKSIGDTVLGEYPGRLLANPA